ncbi:hypothetical protein [Streptomyces chartreusis]|uniref:hypothetical protein n=1 Tax=Streptomyces chartreusis TaxID=1969 RepID=UPI00382F9D18
MLFPEALTLQSRCKWSNLLVAVPEVLPAISPRGSNRLVMEGLSGMGTSALSAVCGARTGRRAPRRLAGWGQDALTVEASDTEVGEVRGAGSCECGGVFVGSVLMGAHLLEGGWVSGELESGRSAWKYAVATHL